jgi:peptide/nickel transport system substrate-binding protein
MDLAYPSDLTVNGLQFADLAQRIKADLAQAGITVNLQGAPVATALQAYRNGTEQMGLWYWGPDYPDPNDYTVFTPGGEVALRAGWTTADDPSLAQAATQAASMSNPQQRATAFQQIQRQMNQSGPFYPLIEPAQVLASTSNLTGVDFNAVWTLDFSGVGSS